MVSISRLERTPANGLISAVLPWNPALKKRLFRVVWAPFGVLLGRFLVALATSCAAFWQLWRVLRGSGACRGSVAKFYRQKELCLSHARSAALRVASVPNYVRSVISQLLDVHALMADNVRLGSCLDPAATQERAEAFSRTAFHWAC